LPRIRVEITMKGKERAPEVLVPYLDTVVLDTMAPPPSTDVLVEMVWRASFRAPRRMKDAEIVIVEKEAA
jgi:hypothetical protein